MDECKNKVNIHLKRAESTTIMSPRSRMALFDKNVQSTPKSCGSNEISKVGKCKEKVNRAKSPIIKSTRSRTEGFDKNVECTVNAFNANEISKMEKCRGQVHIQLERAKSPIIMTPRSRMALHDKKVLSTPNLLGSHEIPKKIEETKLQQDKTTIICPSKSLKHLNVCCNLQSTPNTRSFNKSVADSRIIMNLSPIKSTLNIKSNLNNDEDMYLYEKNSVSLDKLNNLNSSNFNIDNGFDNKLKTNENIKRLCNESNVHNSLYLSVNPREKHEDNVNEKTKRCLFEKENVNNISNVDTDQESLNISLDILEQVCQMSEMMDDSMSEEIHISANFERKKNKLSYFLYGDSSTKLEDTEKENELLQLALNMEDNLLTEIKSKNKLPYEGKFTSLNQLTNQISDLSKNDSKQYKNEKLKININDLLGNNLDTIDILEIGNTQMCEIANITEPLESFDDQWTQQYTCNESNLYNVKKKICLNNSLKSKGNVSNMVFKSSVDNINYRIDVKKGDLIDDITNDNSKNVRSVLKNETNFPTITKDKTFMNTSTCNGFSTAEGKSIKVSDKALHKVQSMFKDEINESSTVTKEKTFTNSDTCISFSTAGGKSIKVSDKALHKVQSMFKDEINENSTVTKDKTFTNTSICNTFSTAGGKSIKVSDKALHKVQSMFKDEINENSTVIKDKTFTNTSICNTFSTAGGKSIKVSDKALHKVQSMFKDEINENSTVTKDKTFTNTSICNTFSTAGGKSIKVSDKALHKVQSMFKDEINENSTVIKDKTFTNTSICNTFSTAGGKSIKVSHKALHKVQSMFKDEINENSTVIKDKTFTNTSICNSFSTAGGKSIKVSDKALHKVQSMFKDEINENSTVIKDKTFTNTSICNTFSTAGGKSIKVSHKALLKIQSMFKDEINENSTVIKDKTFTNTSICNSFSTAGGKSIKVSDKALHKVQSMFKDEINENSTVIKDKTFTNTSICNTFSTAGGKSIKVSHKALHKVQSMFKDEINENSTVIKDKTFTNTSICNSFSTAGGKSIKVSDKALHKVQSMFKDEINENSTVIKDKTFTNTSICNTFSTAGGKSIKVSHKALHKVQSMFKDEINENSTVIKDKTFTNTSICNSFSTAGGKSIKVSDKALHKVQSMFKDEINENSTVTKDKTFTNTSICNSFSTAGGKSIKVSDKALHKVQSMFKDEINENSTVTKDKTFTNTSICNTFSTAGGKSIKVSDKALHKVQSMFKDEINENSTVIKDKTFTNTSICNTFSTAGGKSIKVSDKALHKVQSMFKEEINDPSTVTNDKTFTNTSICNSFSIAGGKSIKVSDIAFYKVQSMFDDDINESSTVNKDETFKNSNTYSGFPTDGCKYIKESHNALHKFQPMVKNERSGLQLNDNLLETMAIFNNCNNYSEQLNCSNTKSTSTCFEVLRNKEECALGNKSLFDTIEKFEKDQSVHKPILKNKRPGSPVYEFNHEIKKTIHDGWWENNVLQISFDEYLAKKLNGPKISLPEVVNWSLPKICNIKQFPENNIHNELIKLNIDNALNFKLHWEKDYKLPDFNRNKIYNFQDIKKLFSSHYFVDDKLIPKKWIENHFCLIVWKLAATEIKFPDHFGNKLLTVKNVTHQLLYRYYREIDKCQRSALKKILEKDETATKRIILCVSKVIKTNIADSYNIELTDGWYSVQGLVDFEMNMLLHKGIVKVGSKLMIHNAQLIGAGEGIDPLEIHDGIKLKISTNSTRRVRWYTKLGFYKNSTQPIPISLESVLPRGGIIGSLSLVILRKYPMMYLERKSNSKSILRNEKMEAIEAEKYKAYQQKSLEIISSKIESELIAEMDASTKKSKSYCLSIKKENLEVLSIDELSNIVENSSDPLEIQSLLSQDTLDALKNFKKSENERFYNEFQNRVNRVFNSQFKDARKVTSLFKLRVVDEKYATTGFKSAMLTVWNPSEEVTTALNKACEGQCYTIHHLTANGLINGDLQISSNKDTRFDFQGFKNEYSKREVASFKNILSGNSMPLFGELDFVGIVISEFSKNDNNYNEIYVSDKEMHIFRVLFQCNIKEYRYDDMMYLGSIISGINLQFKGLNQMSSIPTLYNTELSLFTTNPKNDHLLSIFDDYKMFMKKSENQDFLKCCQNRLSEIHNRNLNKLTTSNEKQHVSTSKYAFHRSYGELPVTVVKTPNATQDTFSPAQKRIKMLNKYGKTPPLNIVHTKPPDKKLMSKFKTPTRL